MEKSLMKKYLIWTALVLAAITACNKEIETSAPVVDNGKEEATPRKVTLTFTAAISEETRTAYAGDKTASWSAGDKITVCLTDSESYSIVEFTTADGTTFSGEVDPGYTTIVSGIYPANDIYTDFSEAIRYFDIDEGGNGSVIGIYLPDEYNLGTSNDTGIAIPMLGEMVAPAVGETPVFTFHHICNALKVTLNSIPADADLFTFSTNGQKVSGDFQLSGGRLTLGSSQNNDTSVSFSFTAGTVTQQRSFYIPIPDGQFVAGAYVTVEKTVEDSDNEVLYKKVINSTPTFGPNAQNGHDAIRRLPAATCWTKKENWNAYYYGPYISSGTIYKRISLENMTGSYNYEVLTSSQFNSTYHGSAADYFSSTHFSDRISGLTTSYSSSGLSLNYNTLPKGTYYVMLFGLDQDRKFTGEYNCVEVVNPTLSTPEGWSISVVDDYKLTYTVPSGTKWTYISISEANFESTYNSDLEYLIYKVTRDHKSSFDGGSSTWAPITAQTKTYTVTYNGNYILLCVGIDDNYRPTGEYCRLDYSFPIPTEAYNAWIGKWTVVDNGSTPNTDTWTITRRQANHSYTVKGLFGYSSDYSFEIKFNEEDGTLIFPSQIYNTSSTLTYWLVGSPSTAANHLSGEYDIMQASFNENDSDHATMIGLNSLKRYYTVSYNKSDGSYYGYYKVRYLPSTMTRVTE